MFERIRFYQAIGTVFEQIDGDEIGLRLHQFF